MNKKNLPIVFIFISIALLAGCGPKVTPSPNQPPATATPVEAPMALRVNGEGITMTEYQAELTRLQNAQADLGMTSTPAEQRDRVLENLTDQLLLAQAAAQGGFTVADATLQARIDALAAEMGGADKLQTWETANGYTDESFRIALKRSIAVAWQRDQIINSVPTTADQVHARQILFQEQGNADNYYQQLETGADFATLAYQVDQNTGGDLGWFPQGYLTQPDVEAAAFALQPGQYSSVIHTELGYHIIYVIERDANHTLSVDARRVLQEKKLDEWLTASKAVSTIEVLVQ
jgi:peptidyl-prolyl cis-trans isomerase C